MKLVQKYEEKFDGISGRYTGSNFSKELKEDAKPYHAIEFPASADSSLLVGTVAMVLTNHFYIPFKKYSSIKKIFGQL